MRRFFIVIFYLLIIVLIAGELVGRWYGLTNYPTFIESDKFEYISAPNQRVKIYRNLFITNAYSMRSESITQSDTNVVLLFGDSVLFGGNQIDQDSLASTLLEKKLNITSSSHVRVLNISSKSWGPDNAAAYVRQYGTFNAKVIVLVFSSGDAYDNMSFTPVVGINDSHPTTNAMFAWKMIWILFERNIREILSKKSLKTLNKELLIADDSVFNSGFCYFDSLTKAKHIPLVIYLHKTINEIKSGTLEKGGDEILTFCKKHNVLALKPNEQSDLYLDYIHFNNRGQKFMANSLFPIIQKELLPIIVDKE